MDHRVLEFDVVHGIGECPSCHEQVHVVGDRIRMLARWVCLREKLAGVLPYDDEPPQGRVAAGQADDADAACRTRRKLEFAS